MRAAPESARVPQRILDERLRMLGIDSNTRLTLAPLRQPLARELGGIVEAFYVHILRFPEVSRIFHGEPSLHLKRRQEAHWREIFECRFDEQYVGKALAIGNAHFQHGIPPRLYLAGHNFFQCRITALAARQVVDKAVLPDLLASIARVIALDLDLALSAYTRAYWTAPKSGDDLWI